MTSSEEGTSSVSDAGQELQTQRIVRFQHFRRYGETYITAFDTEARPNLTPERRREIAKRLASRSLREMTRTEPEPVTPPNIVPDPASESADS